MRTVDGPTENVVVVGAGLGGLSAALHLAGAGRRVTVVERAAVPGGRCGLIADAGYRFDTGPTVLTMPELVAAPLNAVGEELGDWLTLHRLDPAYRARFADGSTIDVRAGVDAMADEIARTCGGPDAAGWLRYVEFLRELYRVEMPHFIERNLDSPLQLVGLPLARLAALGGFRRLNRTVARFVRDERLQRLFSFQAMYAGLSPAQALSIYAVITYMDCVEGVYFPEGGMHAVPRALAGAAAKHGVEFRYDTAVTAVEVRDGRARGVLTAGGERIAADVVVVNADLPTAYGELLPPGYTPRRVRRLRYSPSAVVLHAGSSTAFDGLTHHTIDFGTAWHDTFDEIIERGRPMSDPSFLLTTPSRTDPALAPPGRHTYYALFPAPNARGEVDWAAHRARYRDEIGETLEKRGYAGFEAGIEVEHLVTPADWQAQGMAAGAPFAAAHTFGQTGPFRSPTLDRRIGNLVLCGSERPARRRRADGAGLGAAGGRADHRGGRPAGSPVIGARELDAAGITGAALRASYARCRQINAEHGKTYFLATLLLPRRCARTSMRCTASPGTSTTSSTTSRSARRPSSARPASTSWTAGFLADLDWGQTSDPVRRAVLDTIRRWQLPSSYFADFLESMRMDLTVSSYATYADLEKYMWGSAAVIGLQMLPVLGRADESTRWDVLEAHAIDLGLAFQLTNFIRDIAEDLRRGRIYLPQESLRLFGVDRDRLARGRVDESIRNLLAWEIERTRRLYAKAEPGIALVHPSSRDCLRTAFTLYSEILDRDRAGRLRRVQPPDPGRVEPARGRGPDRPARGVDGPARRPAHTHRLSVASTIAKPNSRSSTGA